MSFLRIAAAQINLVVGDVDGNLRGILEAMERAEEAEADTAGEMVAEPGEEMAAGEDMVVEEAAPAVEAEEPVVSEEVVAARISAGGAPEAGSISTSTTARKGKRSSTFCLITGSRPCLRSMTR